MNKDSTKTTLWRSPRFGAEDVVEVSPEGPISGRHAIEKYVPSFKFPAKIIDRERQFQTFKSLRYTRLLLRYYGQLRTLSVQAQSPVPFRDSDHCARPPAVWHQAAALDVLPATGHFIRNRRLQKLPRSFADEIFQVALGFIFGSPELLNPAFASVICSSSSGHPSSDTQQWIDIPHHENLTFFFS